MNRSDLDQTVVAKAAAAIRRATKVAVLTGAGVSKESGIPTFREEKTGLWAKHDPQQLASPQGFKNDPELVWQWYDMRRQNLAHVEPNAAHVALAEMENRFLQFALLTQNVDGLHKRAGSKNVFELHGNLTRFHCFDRLHPTAHVPVGLPQPPLCHCGSLIRPSVVWFGEGLDHYIWKNASIAARECNVILVIGTSALVQPAALLPLDAKRNGAKIIEVNPEQTALTEHVDAFIKAPAAVALPALLEQIAQR